MIAGATETWALRRVLVTGATGFVGSWVVKKLLARQAQVVALVSDLDYQSAGRARKVLGWRPHYNLQEGLCRTVPWYQDFLGLRA